MSKYFANSPLFASFELPFNDSVGDMDGKRTLCIVAVFVFGPATEELVLLLFL